jgi:hypothetical protein
VDAELGSKTNFQQRHCANCHVGVYGHFQTRQGLPPCSRSKNPRITNAIAPTVTSEFTVISRHARDYRRAHDPRIQESPTPLRQPSRRSLRSFPDTPGTTAVLTIQESKNHQRHCANRHVGVYGHFQTRQGLPPPLRQPSRRSLRSFPDTPGTTAVLTIQESKNHQRHCANRHVGVYGHFQTRQGLPPCSRSKNPRITNAIAPTVTSEFTVISRHARDYRRAHDPRIQESPTPLRQPSRRSLRSFPDTPGTTAVLPIQESPTPLRQPSRRSLRSFPDTPGTTAVLTIQESNTNAIAPTVTSEFTVISRHARDYRASISAADPNDGPNVPCINDYS